MAFATKTDLELVKDLYWSLSLYDDFDSGASEDIGGSNDYGVTTSVGWSFN